MLDWDEFEWDQENEEHIARHDVDPYEAEEAVQDPGSIHWRTREGRFFYIGMAENGRVLVVILDRKGRHLWRVATAREAIPKERKAYRRRNR